MNKAGISFGKIVDRDCGVWNGKLIVPYLLSHLKDTNADGECDEDTEIVYHAAGETSGTGGNWICYVDDQSSLAYPIRELADLCSSTQIAPSDATVTIISANGEGVLTSVGDPLNQDLTEYTAA